MLQRGKPTLGLILLAAGVLSIGMLVYEGSRESASAGLPTFRHADKLLHLGAHFWVSSLGFWGLLLLGRPLALRRRATLTSIVVLILDTLAGVAIEYVQSSLGAAHGRRFDWVDVAANVTGAALAILLGVTVVILLSRAYTRG